MKHEKNILVWLFVFAMIAPADAQDTLQPVKKQKTPGKAIAGFIDPNVYYDTRGSYDFTLNALAVLPLRFVYFTFANYGTADENPDLTGYYSEHHLYWGVSEKSPFDLSLQWMNLSGNMNDALRLGFRWRAGSTSGIEKIFKTIGLTYTLAFHVFQFDDARAQSPWMAQIEHFYHLSLFKNRIYITDFADQDIHYDNSKLFTFVTEHQLGFRIIDNLFAVAEYRLNDYFPVNKTGVGLGLEYFIGF